MIYYTDYKRYQLRSNIEVDIKPWLSVGTNLFGYMDQNNPSSENASAGGDVIFGSGAFNTVPGMTLFDPVTGLYGCIQNPEEENVSNFNPYRRQWFYKTEYPTKTKRSVISLNAVVKPITGLSIRGAFSYNYWERNIEHHLTDRDLFRFTFEGPVLIREGVVRTYIRRYNYKNTFRESELTADYNFSIGNTFSSNSSGVQNHWQYLYELVHRANTVIRNVADMPINQETINRVTGEAKFLRGMVYFRMLNCWGGVPYYDETCDINEQFARLDSPRSSAEGIRKHIIEDLTDAIELLPVSWEAADLGRATKGAAYALRGKVYLYNREWEKAANDFEEIVYNKNNDYGYTLHADYNELFRLYNGQHSKEMVFSIQSIDGNTSGYALNIVGYYGNKSTMRLIASNCIVPSTTLVDMYENLDGSPFNWDDIFPGFNDGDAELRRSYMSVAINQNSTEVINTLDCDTTKVMDAYRLRDPRLCLNVITPYSHYLGTDAGSNPMDKQFVLADPSKGGSPMEAMAFIRNSEGWDSYFWRKWIPTGNLDGYWGEYNRTPYEFPLIRLGDVILMLAEAYNESGWTDKAIVEVNKIRSRVGMPGLNSGAGWLKVVGQKDMAERIRRERAFELVGEGVRYWDLRRWGLLEQSVKDATDIFGNLMYTRSYQTRHELWPIPLVEMERNTNLIQNPGW